MQVFGAGAKTVFGAGTKTDSSRGPPELLRVPRWPEIRNPSEALRFRAGLAPAPNRKSSGGAIGSRTKPGTKKPHFLPVCQTAIKEKKLETLVYASSPLRCGLIQQQNKNIYTLSVDMIN